MCSEINDFRATAEDRSSDPISCHPSVILMREDREAGVRGGATSGARGKSPHPAPSSLPLSPQAGRGDQHASRAIAHPPIVNNDFSGVVDDPLVVNDDFLVVNDDSLVVNDDFSGVIDDPLIVNDDFLVVIDDSLVVNDDFLVVNDDFREMAPRSLWRRPEASVHKVTKRDKSRILCRNTC